ncbi:MAG: hypothetical protein EOP04_26020 [Proteobacteria bacterium]|nr:MAG: hypothetical protein EOP04_26020 [Pseudomonadota bacterium]
MMKFEISKSPLSLLASLFLGLFSSSMTQAQSIDFGAGLSGRTHSPGLSLDPYLGLNQVVWGDTSTPFFGYVRPFVKGSLTPTLIAGKTGVDFFPVSFISVGAARTWTRRYRETGGYDCDAYRCIGDLNSSEINAVAMGAYESYFVSASLQRQFYDDVSGDQDIMDPSNALIYKRTGSTLNSWSGIIGKKVGEGVRAGFILQRGDLDDKIRASEAVYAFVRSDLKPYGWNDFNATVGIGRFDSDTKNPGLSLILLLNWVGASTPGPVL